MEKPFYRKPVVWIVAVIFVIALAGVFILKNRQDQAPIQDDVTPAPDEVLPTIDASVAVDLVRSGEHAVNLTIKNIPADIQSIEYELSYLTGQGLPKGALSGRPIELKPGEKEFSREILLGTCSKNVCVYDEGVSEFTLVLKFNSASGARVFQKKYSL